VKRCSPAERRRRARYRAGQAAIESARLLGAPIQCAPKGVPDPIWMSLLPHHEFDWDKFRYRHRPADWDPTAALQMRYGASVLRPQKFAETMMATFSEPAFFNKLSFQNLPRRNGKSATLSAIADLFKGNSRG
jgi:hypothetical protein